MTFHVVGVGVGVSGIRSQNAADIQYPSQRLQEERETPSNFPSICLYYLRKGFPFTLHGHVPASWTNSSGEVMGLLPLARPESHAHFCEGRGWLGVLSEFYATRKGPLSHRKEVRMGACIIPEKRKKEGWTGKHTRSSLHTCCLILSHSEPMENTRN